MLWIGIESDIINYFILQVSIVLKFLDSLFVRLYRSSFQVYEDTEGGRFLSRARGTGL